MLLWIPHAFVRLILFFIGGILLGIYFPEAIGIQLATGLCVALVVFYLARFLSPWNFITAINAGILGLPLIMLFGYLLVLGNIEKNARDHIYYSADSIVYYKLIVSSYPEERENSWRSEGNITEICTHKGWQSSRGKVLLYFKKAYKDVPYSYGSILLVKGKPQRVSPPSNPHEFDYSRYLSFRNIYHQHFVGADEVYYIDNHPESVLLDVAFSARALATRVINQHVSGGRERAIASALVLGVTDNLDDELVSAYASSGAMHVLAVSGLHVGILYGLILIILRPLRKFSWGEVVVATISVFVLWNYALITGFSPSVLRAVTMFSLVAFAQLLRRKSNIYNTLALSAFCLLLFDPFLIMSVGFQLSYLAVLGIVYLYPRLNLLWAPSSWFMSSVWKITCVSLAAQTSTFFLSLLYFHQFPVYFLVTNLFVIPLAFATMVAGLALIGFSFLTPVASFLGMVLSFVIQLLNGVVLLTESLPGSLISGIHITTFQCWLLIGLILTFTLLFQVRKFWLLYMGLAIAVGFALIQWVQWAQQQKARLVVYNVSDHFAMDIFERGNAFHFSDSVLAGNPGIASFQIDNNRIASSVQNVYNGSEFPLARNQTGCRLIQWKDVLLLQIMHKDFNFTRDLPVDYVVISNNAVRNIEDLDGKVSYRFIIVDSSNSTSGARALVSEAATRGVRIYSVLHQGAFITEL